jgi:hypothetical protein
MTRCLQIHKNLREEKPYSARNCIHSAMGVRRHQHPAGQQGVAPVLFNVTPPIYDGGTMTHIF